MVIFDTGIIIALQHGDKRAARLHEKNEARAVSIITYMEFIQRAPSKKIANECKKFFRRQEFAILSLTPEIGNKAAQLMENFNLSHSLAIPDALIAATAIENDLPLATTNYKHFKMIKNLELVKA